MEKLFESPILVKLQNFGQKLGTNRFLGALQATMMSLMGIIIIGAISQIICALGCEGMLNLFKTGDAVYNILYMPYHFTMNMLSLWLVTLFTYNYAKNLKMKSPIMNTVNATVCFLLIAAGLLVNPETKQISLDMTYLGAQGMFVGFLVVFISVNIEKLCIEKNVRIKMPDSVPSFLQDGFSAILPLLFSIILFLGISTIVSFTTEGAYTICSGIMALLAAPLKALTSLPGMFILGIFSALLWCFGIHGTMILVPIITPLAIQAAMANGAAYAAGEPLIFYPVFLFSCTLMCGGAGNTLALSILGLRSKSKQINAVAKLSLLPGWFGINEPLTFGMPIMYNPILCIPYVLNIPIVMLLTYIGYQIGFLSPGFIPLVATLPMGFSNYLTTLRWQNAAWVYLMLIPTGLIWYPFFKIYEKQLIAKEKAAAALEAEETQDS